MICSIHELAPIVSTYPMFSLTTHVAHHAFIVLLREYLSILLFLRSTRHLIFASVSQARMWTTKAPIVANSHSSQCEQAVELARNILIAFTRIVLPSTLRLILRYRWSTTFTTDRKAAAGASLKVLIGKQTKIDNRIRSLFQDGSAV